MKNTHVIILHGWAISAQNEVKWAHFRKALSENGIASTFLKLPGLSSPLEKPWSLGDYVTWLEEELGSQKNILLLGHSFGGQLAVRYAATHPEQIKKLILVASAGVRDMSLRARCKRFVFFYIFKVGKIFFSHPQVKSFFYKLVGEHDYEVAPPVMKKTMSTILADEIKTDLPKLACPVQLVWGDGDTSAPYRNAQFFLNTIPNARLCTVKHARHSPQFTHPSEVAECITQFLS